MLGFFKKRLFRRMNAYVDIIRFITCAQISSKQREQHDADYALTLSAAVTNRIFGAEISPLHSDISSTTIDEIATDYLQNEEDKDLLLAIMVSLKTLITLAEEKGTTIDLVRRSRALQWLGEIIPLPDDDPDPDMMEDLVSTLKGRYPKVFE